MRDWSELLGARWTPEMAKALDDLAAAANRPPILVLGAGIPAEAVVLRTGEVVGRVNLRPRNQYGVIQGYLEFPGSDDDSSFCGGRVMAAVGLSPEEREWLAGFAANLYLDVEWR